MILILFGGATRSRRFARSLGQSIKIFKEMKDVSADSKSDRREGRRDEDCGARDTYTAEPPSDTDSRTPGSAAS